MFPPDNIPPFRSDDPLYRTTKIDFVENEGSERVLSNEQESASFNEHGLNKDIRKAIIFSDADVIDPVNGRCTICIPPTYLPSEFHRNCMKCGRGTCPRHRRVVATFTGKKITLCNQHFWCTLWLRLSNVFLVLLAPLFFIKQTKDSNDE